MATSTINGSPGTAYNGAIVTAFTLLNNVPAGVATSDVVSSGSFSLKGLAAGTYRIKIVLNDRQFGQGRAGDDFTNALNVNVVQVDGSSTYAI
jgi:hypothetical protein